MLKKIKYRLKRIKRFIIKCILRVAAILVYRVKKVGNKNLPKKGAYILCANHVHGLDAPIVILCLNRETIFIAKEELFRSRAFRFLANSFDIISIKRGSADIEAMKSSFKVLKEGKLLGIFPEGTRKGMEKGEPFHNGAALISLKTGTPVIPIGIIGDFKPFRKVILNIGKPLDFSEYKGQTKDKEVLTTVTNKIMAEVVRLTNEIK